MTASKQIFTAYKIEKKIVRPRVKFFEPVPQRTLHLTGTSPQLALPPTDTFPNCNFPIMELSPTGTSENFAGTPR